ncbi:MAG TPA: Gfo/Idh/MocA family oxidoreductase [Armatimonadota bacterium]|nr:Gfo/Idh/MocA family oxidoreductase [Armatimonadota bacterium]
MDRLRVGVVGLGRNGRHFAAGYARSERSVLAGVCDLKADVAEEMRSEHGAEAAYTDLGEMLAAADLDVLSVHTPDHLHADPFVAGLQAGCHVFVEKPMGNSMDDIERMVAAARASDRKTAVGHILRFNPFFAEVHRLCAAGELGEVFYLEADYIHNLEGQADPARINPHIGNINWYLEREKPIVGGGAHQLDLLRWFAGSDVIETFGYGNSIAFPQMKYSDCMSAVFKMQSGAVAKVTALYGPIGPRPEHSNLEVYGTKGTVRRGRFMRGEGHEVTETVDLSAHEIAGHPYEPEIEDFMAAIVEDRQPRCDAFDGANSAAATVMAAESILSGRPEPVPVYAR